MEKLQDHKIQHIYSEIFKSYSGLELNEHLKKIDDYDNFLPLNSTFFCVINTQKLSFEYVSKNVHSCIGFNRNDLLEKGIRHYWNRIHPDDIELWLFAIREVINFTLSEIPVKKRRLVCYTWNYRLKNNNGVYVNIIQNTTPIGFDSVDKPIILLAHYTVLNSNLEFDISACAKILNDKNEYETIFYKNFSQKKISNNISKRERDIIRLLVLDLSSKEIADKLFISHHTVNTHRKNILQKLNISSTGELVALLKMNKLCI